jgi:hypothetical protein
MPRGYDQWRPLPLDKTLFANLPEGAVTGGYQTAIENGFHQRARAATPAFPDFRVRRLRRQCAGLPARFQRRPDRGRLQGQVRASTATPTSRTCHRSAGGGRPPRGVCQDRPRTADGGGRADRAAARLKDRTAVVGGAACSPVAWLDNFTIAVEINSGRFFHSSPGAPDQWDPLDTFAADGNPDNINSLLVTPARELMLGGEDSIEQFERSDGGDAPFARRWAIGAGGVKLPYAIAVRRQLRLDHQQPPRARALRRPGAGSQSDEFRTPAGGDRRLVGCMDGGYPDRPLHIRAEVHHPAGPERHQCLRHQGRDARLFDYENGKRFFSLYGWDRAAGVPSRWPGWSHWTLWDRVFVGGEGKVYELDPRASQRRRHAALADPHRAHGERRRRRS